MIMIRIAKASRIPAEDLRVIAAFFRIIKNYEKMLRIEKMNK